jgi:hypothetical protein
MLSGAQWYVSNQTLHEDLKIPLIQDMIKSNINKYKNRTSMNENQLIKDLFTQTLEERRLKRIWPEDLDEVQFHGEPLMNGTRHKPTNLNHLLITLIVNYGVDCKFAINK